MLLKICVLGCLAVLVATEELAAGSEKQLVDAQTNNQFETSHKVPETSALNDEGFHTAHKISIRATDAATDYSMNLLATKERPELNPILSALINEDVMKSIEAKRAIEEEELAEVRREIEEAALMELSQNRAVTEQPALQLTTQATATKKIDMLDDDMLVDPHDDFVNQNFALDGAGSENNKKSRIEIKKGPNGQDYEYEYVYYYEDEEEPDSKAKPAIAAPAAVEAPAELTPEARGKTRYSNIDRSTPATPSENSLHSGKAKGRAASENTEDIEAERLPLNTRFPSRGKNIDVQPTPALDSLETAAERKKISVKRPSLELVDSQTFNTDEKQLKGSRNADKELKSVIAVEQEEAAAAAAAAAAAKQREEEQQRQQKAAEEEAGQTTPSMEKAALDLYAILTNENLNMDETTAADSNDETTANPDTASTNMDDDSLTTLQEELSSTTTTTTTTSTTTTTTEAPTTTTTTTTTTAQPSLFGGRRSGLNSLAGRNRFKLRDGGSTSTTSTTETAPTETTKTGRNRFSRPSIGGRSRPGARTTASPEPAAEAAVEEEIAPAKEVKPVSSGFARGRPRNRFNLRGASTTTTTEKSNAGEESADGASSPESVASTTARSSIRSRPGLNLRGRSRTTTTKAPAAAEGSAAEEGSHTEEGKAAGGAAAAPAAVEPVRPSRFNLHRAGGNRLLPRGKLGRAGATTEAPKDAAEDSAADSSHHNDVKGTGEGEGGEAAEKTEEGDTNAANHAAGHVSGLNRLKNRPRLNALHKTDAAKQKAAASPGAAPASSASSPSAAPASSSSPAAAAPRKINPLLAKRRLHLGGAAAAAATSTTESPAEDEQRSASSSSDGSGEQPAKEDAANAANSNESGDSAAGKEQETTEAAEATTKQQARGLGLLGQRRRLPLRKPGTIL